MKKGKVVKRGKYQGKEFTSTLQASTLVELNVLIDDSRKLAGSQGMLDFKVLEKGKDPDGGYRAIVVAHNFNPLQWVKEKLGRGKKKPRVIEGEFEDIPKTGEDIKKEEEQRQKKAEAEQETRDRQARERVTREADEEIEGEQMENQARRAARKAKAGRRIEEAGLEEEIGALPDKEREKLKKRYWKARGEQVEAAFERYESGAPSELSTIQKIWVNVPGESFGGHYEFREVKRTLTPFERLALAREAKSEEIDLKRKEAAYKKELQERRLPVRAVKALGKFGTHMAAVGMLGVAGTAQAVLPRESPRRVLGRFIPSAHPGLYGFSSPPTMDLSGLRQTLIPRINLGGGLGHLRKLGGLEHLRSATLPGRGRVPLTIKPVMFDLSKLRRRI